MKKIIYTISLCAAFGLALFGYACNDGELIYDETGQAAVSIEEVSRTSEEIIFSIIPNSYATSVKYALGSATDRESFLAGSLTGIQQKEASSEFDFKVDTKELITGRSYALYAQAFEGSQGGSIATYTFNMDMGSFECDVQFVSDVTAAFALTATTEYYITEYIFVEATYGESVKNGNIAMTQWKDLYDYTFTYFELTPQTDYVFFIKGYSRYGTETELMEFPITTSASGSVPGVDFTVDHIDVYKGDYTISPNSLCGGYAVFVSGQDEYISTFNGTSQVSFHGDVLNGLDGWNDSDTNVTAAGTSATTFDYLTPARILNNPLDIFILIYDKNNEPFSVEKRTVSTPSFDSNAGTSALTVSIGSFDEYEITFTVTPNIATLGFNCTVIPDYTFRGVSPGNSSWIPLIKYDNWNYTNHSTVPVTITLEYPSHFGGEEASYGFYLMAVPMNDNGDRLDGGWGDVFYELFEPARP